MKSYTHPCPCEDRTTIRTCMNIQRSSAFNYPLTTAALLSTMTEQLIIPGPSPMGSKMETMQDAPAGSDQLVHRDRSVVLHGHTYPQEAHENHPAPPHQPPLSPILPLLGFGRVLVSYPAGEASAEVRATTDATVRKDGEPTLITTR